MYVTGLNCAYMNQNGGLGHYISLANQRGAMLWAAIDGSNGYYSSKLVQKGIRSRVNVIFRIQGGNAALEARFIEEAQKNFITQIKGHSFCPGIRISMYNAMPVAGVSHLVEFMRRFSERYPAKSAAKL